ncbi:hypothetical protein Patl1_22021 [Pistacia atlantica]|uniref:Uncharacterized protein n=1 Tax=Pistacia atlantica TaxID=434234 RepID=A0ACC1BJS5_9ROSI|nr:hypothetical protein Patl1_22021 [Pistacia atlantica]
MGDEKDAFYVVRKGDIVGIYKSLSDCQLQAGLSVCDPSVTVFKGHGLPKEAEEYLASHGLQNAMYTVGASDVKDDLFGKLVPCPFQEPASFGGNTSDEVSSPKRMRMDLGYISTTPLNQANSSNCVSYCFDSSSIFVIHCSCVLKFDGASKGNPGLAGAGAVLRAEDGSMVCRLREGVGIATNNVAEYRAVLLGLKYALKKGFKNIRVQGDSKLVCMQIQGLWKVNNPNLAGLCKEAKELKDKFQSFQISHVLREYNSEADAQANLGVHLLDGQIEEDITMGSASTRKASYDVSMLKNLVDVFGLAITDTIMFMFFSRRPKRHLSFTDKLRRVTWLHSPNPRIPKLNITKMATVSAFSTLHSSYIVKPRTYRPSSSRSFAISMRTHQFQTKLTLKSDGRKSGFEGMRRLRLGEEEGTLVTEQETEGVQEQEQGEGEDTVVAAEEQQPVAVPVSPSDKVTMHFQGTEGITDLKVQVLESIATVELKKQTTVQATGAAASLIEIIQGSGFKLQTLNLSFEDEEEVLV